MTSLSAVWRGQKNLSSVADERSLIYLLLSSLSLSCGWIWLRATPALSAEPRITVAAARLRQCDKSDLFMGDIVSNGLV